jgi:hypothetical protein
MSSLFAAYRKEAAEIDADREAIAQIRVESEMLRDDAMAALKVNAKAWSVIGATDDAGARLRLCEEIRLQLESLKRNAGQRDEILERLNVTTQRVFRQDDEGHEGRSGVGSRSRCVRRVRLRKEWCRPLKNRST